MSLSNVTAEFTRDLPKVELHAHLSGSISRQCLHEIWQRKKAQNPGLAAEDPWVVMPYGKEDYSLTNIAYATHSVLDDFRHDGVCYLELRTIPRASPDSSFTREEYLHTILTTIETYRLTHPDLTINLILSIDRANASATAALAIVDLALAHRARGIVGIDLCGNPTKGENLAIFAPAFAKAKAHGLGITLHFAEIDHPPAEDELSVLLGFWPDRLGHVLHVPERIKEEIVRRQIGLEVCLSCNVLSQMWEGGFADHPFGHWRGECPVVLCTDDVGFLCSPVSNEYRLVAEHFHLDRRDILRMARNAVNLIFGGEEEKSRLRRLLDAFEASHDDTMIPN
ncbi:hypothetical protein EYZ11_003987 [Aspergillus tanneri]|uniref:Adenosine deaminase domain-containing protein n=1 Tax=Aspergillus tanneri TaxID=1220188 RepID=A0A4S3JM28_9EURO|nr:hypothetical protein EYZ11_003987 [Aspergillus tanneri]